MRLRGIDDAVVDRQRQFLVRHRLLFERLPFVLDHRVQGGVGFGQVLGHLANHQRPVGTLGGPLVLGRHLLDRLVLDLFHVLLELFNPRFSLGQFLLVALANLRRGDVGQVRGRAGIAVPAVATDVPEERKHPVVIGLGNRVDLVVVAAGAVHRHAEERLRRGRDVIVELVIDRLLAVGRFVVPEAEAIVTGGDDAVGIVGVHLVAGELLSDELVVRLVVVEALDDEIAETPDVRLGAVAFIAIGFAIADDVEPVPAPLFAVMRRGEQLVDKFFVRVRGHVPNEDIHLLRRRRQAGEVEVQPAGQGEFVGGFRRSEVFRLQFGQDERVNRVGDPGGVLDRRKRRPDDRLVCPVILALRRHHAGLRFDMAGALGVLHRQVGADPLGQCFQRGGRQFAGGRHLQVVAMVDRLDQDAVLDLLGVDRRAQVAPLEDRRAGQQGEISL